MFAIFSLEFSCICLAGPQGNIEQVICEAEESLSQGESSLSLLGQ